LLCFITCIVIHTKFGIIPILSISLLANVLASFTVARGDKEMVHLLSARGNAGPDDWAYWDEYVAKGDAALAAGLAGMNKTKE
jgi:hypothetical protein